MTKRPIQASEIEEFLRACGVRYDRAVRDTIPYQCKWTGKELRWVNPIVYFLSEGHDVAYYIPSIKGLLIHENPRPWDAHALSQAEDVDLRNI